MGEVMDWFNSLTELVSKNNMVIMRFSAEEWGTTAYTLRSWNSISPFTIARSHSLLDDFSVPTVSLLYGEGPVGTEAFIGLIDSKQTISTLESRIKVVGISPISPDTENELLQLVKIRGTRTEFRRRLSLRVSVVAVGTELSAHLIDRLAANEGNHRSMRTVFAAMNSPKAFSSNAALQQDAVNLALKAFGLPTTASALLVETREDSDTSLERVSDMEYRNEYEDQHIKIYEDAVIEHDARNVPGFNFVGSDLTGRAIFENGVEQLEVITANRRPLERVFGVDLIYLNATKQNVVMIQYKMLEPHSKGRKTDWIYRPDDQFEREVERMKRFGQTHPPGSLEYRINSQVFYLRFVRRDAVLGKAAATMPLDHFEVLRENPDCEGPQGAFRITYDTLGGRYLRQQSFLELLRSGYIGAHAKTTADLETLMKAILNDQKAVVGALQFPRKP